MTQQTVTLNLTAALTMPGYCPACGTGRLSSQSPVGEPVLRCLKCRATWRLDFGQARLVPGPGDSQE